MKHDPWVSTSYKAKVIELITLLGIHWQGSEHNPINSIELGPKYPVHQNN